VYRIILGPVYDNEKENWRILTNYVGLGMYREWKEIEFPKEWQEKLYNKEEWKKLLRMARNRRILHMPMD
jgi:hypothetical protein